MVHPYAAPKLLRNAVTVILTIDFAVIGFQSACFTLATLFQITAILLTFTGY
jgi:hypothetical protein